jgi:hypothetical protein
MMQYLLNRFAAFGTTIGRRKGAAAGTFGQYLPVLTFARQHGGVLAINTYPGDKHCAAWLRAGGAGQVPGTGAGMVMEVRFPKSTLNIDDLRSVLDYVYAVREWVRAAPNHTMACIFYDNIMLASGAASLTLDGLFLQWLTTKQPGLYDQLMAAGITPVAGKRLEVMTAEFTKLKNPVLEITRITANDNASRAQQALRLGALLGKGADLQGEQNYGGNIHASSVRAVR